MNIFTILSSLRAYTIRAYKIRACHATWKSAWRSNFIFFFSILSVRKPVSWVVSLSIQFDLQSSGLLGGRVSYNVKILVLYTDFIIMPDFFWGIVEVCLLFGLFVLVQDCRVGKYSKTSVGAGTWWSLLISDSDAYYLMISSLLQLSVCLAFSGFIPFGAAWS